MTERILVTALFILFTLTACEQKENVAGPTPQPAPPAPAPAPASDGWKGLPGADQVNYEIDLQEGEKVYAEVCATCHREGVAGAPRIGEKEAWQERSGKGLPVLIENSIKGYQGSKGVMPPKGGAQSLSDAQVASAAVYMILQARGEEGAQGKAGGAGKQD